MKVTDTVILDLISDIYNNIRRRTASLPNEIKYIDKEGNLPLLDSNNFNIIIGRRGTGKSALISKSIINHKDEPIIEIDCQQYHDNYTKNEKDIVIDCLMELINKIEEEINQINIIENKKILLFNIKVINKTQKIKKETCLQALNQIKNTLMFAKEMDDDYLHTTRNSFISNSNENAIKKQKEMKFHNYTEGKFLISNKSNAHLTGKYKNLLDSCIQVNSSINSLTEGYLQTEKQISEKNDKSSNTQIETEFHNEKNISKTDLLISTKDNIITLLKLFEELSTKKIRMYLDEFSQIQILYHPFIIHFLHDIHKLTSNFYPKIVAIPGTLKLNDDSYKGFRLNDDFAIATVGYDISEINLNKQFLLQILIAQTTKDNICIDDVESLFLNDYILKLALLASGCIPRDFMNFFVRAVQTAKILNKEKIDLEVLINVLNKIKIDKENEISDSSITIPINQIIKAKQEIANFISVYKTNVFLYPFEKLNDEKHRNLLDNLVNLRYLHLLYERKTLPSGDDFKCYLIDMTFYPDFSSDFNFIQIWNNNIEISQDFFFEDNIFIDENMGQIGVQQVCPY